MFCLLLFFEKPFISLQKERTRKDRKGRKNKNGGGGTNNIGNKSSSKDGRSQSANNVLENEDAYLCKI